MHQKEFVAKDGQTYLIRLEDTGQEISIWQDTAHMGVIDLHFTRGIGGAESYLVTVLDLEKCKGKGIAEAALRFHKEIFHRPLKANGDVREGRRSRENQLTPEGIGFIGSMRKKGVIELADFHNAFSEDE